MIPLEGYCGRPRKSSWPRRCPARPHAMRACTRRQCVNASTSLPRRPRMRPSSPMKSWVGVKDGPGRYGPQAPPTSVWCPNTLTPWSINLPGNFAINYRERSQYRLKISVHFIPDQVVPIRSWKRCFFWLIEIEHLLDFISPFRRSNADNRPSNVLRSKSNHVVKFSPAILCHLIGKTHGVVIEKLCMLLRYFIHSRAGHGLAHLCAQFSAD